MAYTFYKIASFSGGWHQGQVGVEIVSQNVPGNYSVLNLIFQVKETTNASSHNEGGANMYIALDGVSQVSNNTIDFRTYATGTWYTNLTVSGVVVYHGSDGNKTISLQGYCGTGVSAGTYNQTESIALPQIARKSTIYSLHGTMEVNGSNQQELIITRADASFTHTVTFVFGTYSQQYTNVATTQNFTIPTSWLNAIPNSTSGTAACWVTTYCGDTLIGEVTGAFTITVPATVIPVVTNITHARDTTGTDPFTTYARGISKVNVSGVSVTNQYSATSSSFKTYLHLSTDAYTLGTLYTGASFISGAIPYAGTMRLTTVVTDSRGRESAAYYEDFTVYDYFAPALTVTAFRCNSAGVADPSGEYLSATMVVNVAPVNNNNTKTYVLEYKKTTDSTWTPISTAALTGYSGTLNAVRSASSANTWEVRASITDKVGTATKTASVLSKRVPINCGHSGTAVAIGKVAETADLLEVDMASQFNKLVSIPGGQIKFPATQVPSTDVNTLDDYEEGTWTPTYYGTTTAGTTTYVTQSGKYTKIGNVLHISLKLEVSAATGTGHIRIGGFPYSITNTGGVVSTFHWGSAITSLMGVIGSGNLFEVYLFSGGTIADASVENAINIRFSGTFYI